MSLPNLAEHLHTPECVLVIRELHKCHEERPIGKFFGQCNELKSLLRKCLTQQKGNVKKESLSAHASNLYQEEFAPLDCFIQLDLSKHTRRKEGEQRTNKKVLEFKE